MEVGRETRTKDVIAKKFVSNRVDSIVKEIHNEYCLKQSKFNPTGNSPNIFICKLRLRMNAYYRDLYNSFKVPILNQDSNMITLS